MEIYRVNKPKSTICSSCKSENPNATHCEHNVRFEDHPHIHGLRKICANCKWFMFNVIRKPVGSEDSWGRCCYNPPSGTEPVTTRANYTCHVYEEING